jgi:Kef-type K+ transport system membrane component KefB
LFLLFISGLEISISKLKKTGKSSIYTALGGVIVPLIFGFFSGILFNFSINESIIIGLILTATSVGVTVRTLMDLHVIDTDVGSTILGGAVIDDVIGIILLAFVLTVGSLMDAVWIFIRIALFFLIFFYLGLRLIDRILNLGEKIHLPKAFLSIALAILLIYSFFADRAGISGIIGAFIAGILIGQNFRSKKITDDVKTIGYGFFIPIFFVWVGASLWKGVDPNLFLYISILIFTSVIIFISIIGKIIGCGIGSKLSGMSYKKSLQVGIGMVPRMELALIIATTAISSGIITGQVAHTILLSTILLTIISTVITPFLLKASFK